MNCRSVRKLLCAVMDDTLESRRREAVDAHLAGCSGCQAHLSELQQSRELLQMLQAMDTPVPPGLGERIKQAARRAQEEAALRQSVPRLAVGSPAFVAICASLAVAALMTWIVATRVTMKGLEVEREAGTAVIAAATNPDFPTVRVELEGAAATVEPRGSEVTATAGGRSASIAQPPAWALRTSRVRPRPRGTSPVAPQQPTLLASAAMDRDDLTPAGSARRNRGNPAAGRSGALAPRGAAAAPKYSAGEQRLASTGLSGPVDRAVFIPGERATRTAGAAIGAGGADKLGERVAASLVARYVVERYAAERGARAQPAVLTSPAGAPAVTPAVLSTPEP